MTSIADFPIRWENPEDANLHWTRDTVHEPTPTLPLRRTYSAQIIEEGIARVNRTFGFPGASRSIVVNG